MELELEGRVTALERELRTLRLELEGLDRTVGGLDVVENHIAEAPRRIFRQLLVTLTEYDPDFPLEDFIRHVRKSELEILDNLSGNELGDRVLNQHLHRRISEIVNIMTPSLEDKENAGTS